MREGEIKFISPNINKNIVTKEIEQNLMHILNEYFYKKGAIDYKMFTMAKAKIDKL